MYFCLKNLLWQLNKETNKGTRKMCTNYIKIIRWYQFQNHLCQQIVRSIDIISLINSPVLPKFSCKVSLIAKTRITLKHRSFLQKNHEKLCFKSNRELIIFYEEDFVEFQPIFNSFFQKNLPQFWSILAVKCSFFIIDLKTIIINIKVEEELNHGNWSRNFVE